MRLPCRFYPSIHLDTLTRSQNRNKNLLTDHPSGNYRFLPGIAPYSCGVVASPGFEIVYVTFQQPPPYRRGFERIAEYLKSLPAVEGPPRPKKAEKGG